MVALLTWALLPQSADAQALVVTTCGTLPLAYKAGSNRPLTQDVNGNACSSASFSGTVSTAATAASSLPTLSAGTGAALYESLGAGLYVQPVFGSASGGGTQVDATHGLPINVLTSVLPTGAATSALQTTGNTSLGSLVTNLGTLSYDGSGYLEVNVKAGGSGSNAAASATGSAVPADAGYTGLNNGGNLIGWIGDSSGRGIVAGAGTAGSAAGGVFTVQGVSSMTPILATVSQATASNLNATVVGAGSAGTANSGVVTVQGIASMTPVLTNPGTSANWGFGTAGSPSSTVQSVQGVSGGTTIPVTAAQGTAANLNATVVGTGTFAVQATLNATPSLANGNGVVPTQGGSVLSATNGAFANLLQGNAVLSTTNPIFITGTGTAGSAATNPITVQGIASMTPILANPGTIATWGLAAIGGTTGSPTNALAAGCQYNSSAPTFSSGAVGGVQCTAAGSLHTTVDNTNANGQATMANSSPVAIASNQSAIPVSPQAVASGGASNYGPLYSAASNNATNVKSSAGTLYTVTVTQSTTTAMELKLYNTSSSPTCSSATGIVDNIPIPSNATSPGYHLTYPVGRAFSTGISFCLVAFGNPASSTDNSNAVTGATVSMTYD